VVLDVLKEHNAFSCKCQAAQENHGLRYPRTSETTHPLRVSYPRRPESLEKHLWKP